MTNFNQSECNISLQHKYATLKFAYSIGSYQMRKSVRQRRAKRQEKGVGGVSSLSPILRFRIPKSRREGLPTDQFQLPTLSRLTLFPADTLVQFVNILSEPSKLGIALTFFSGGGLLIKQIWEETLAYSTCIDNYSHLHIYCEKYCDLNPVSS